MQLLKKLSAKEILGPVHTIVAEMAVGDVKDAYAVAGTCNAYETGTSTFGDWTRFVGDLQGVNYITGEVMRAPKAHVPDTLEAVFLTGIAEHSTVVGEKCTKNTKFYELDKAIEFAYQVRIERLEDKDDGAISYKYICVPKTEIKQNDGIAHLTRLISPPNEAPEPEPKEKPKDTEDKEKPAGKSPKK